MSAEPQLVLEWGERGLAACPGRAVAVASAHGFEAGAAAAVLREARRDPDRLVLSSGLEDAADTARRLLAEQLRLGRRLPIAVIAAGGHWPDGAPRWNVGDLLAAGALVDALCEAGIDFHSPACAVASAAYVELRGAVRHLVSAERASAERTD